jgi:hypothetical protein
VINSDQAKTIFIMEGTNDIKDSSISIDTAAYNLEQMANICAGFNMETYLSTIVPRQGWEGLIRDRIYELNGRISSIASSPYIRFVDIFSAFYYYPGGWPNLFSDTTHPNETGYQIIAGTWYDSYFQTLPSRIDLNKDSLRFKAEISQPEIPPKGFKIRNAGGGTLAYKVSPNGKWIDVSPSSGESTGESDFIEVTVDPSGLTYGTHEGEVAVTAKDASNSPQKVDIELLIKIPPLYPPANFAGEKIENRALFRAEYINILRWEANERNEVDIDTYRIYLIGEEGRTLITEAGPAVFEHTIRGVEKDIVYRYGISALDTFGRESDIAFAEIK